jgi:hypothetical protein
MSCTCDQVNTSRAGEEETLAMLRKKEEDGESHDNKTNSKEGSEVSGKGK